MENRSRSMTHSCTSCGAASSPRWKRSAITSSAISSRSGAMTASPDAAAATRGGVRMPDFFVIGHAKCGTTALYEMLCKHPQIYMPEYKRGAGKEPWYFSRDNPNPQLTDKRSVEFTGRKGMTLQEYLSLFSEAGENQVLGEASTSYIWSRG